MRRTFWFGLLGVLLPWRRRAGNPRQYLRHRSRCARRRARRDGGGDQRRHAGHQNLATNDSGYFEAPLLNPGNYSVTVQMTGFRTATRTNIVLGVGQQLTVPFMLEVGRSPKRSSSAQKRRCSTPRRCRRAPTSTVASWTLPMFSNMPITLSRFRPA